MANATHCAGRKVQPFHMLDKLVSRCYDKFDQACGELDLYQIDSKDYMLTQRRADRWYKRAHRFAELRDWVQS